MPGCPRSWQATRSLPATDLILDGEALTLDEAGRPRPFQETASTTATHSGATGIRPFFFDLLLHEDDSLIESPTRDRLARLDEVVPEALRVRRLVTESADEAQEFFDRAVADGQEGVILKRLDAPYDAGRRGSAWVKVKPRHTLDLVVLAVEWGSGRRQGWLSNIHLGARGPDDGEFVMLGKTFKGMTDEMLAWQTERFLALETGREGHVVHLRPEQVVEIAFDGVQRSTRYPGGVALRFARVLRYRDDKPPAETDTLELGSRAAVLRVTPLLSYAPYLPDIESVQRFTPVARAVASKSAARPRREVGEGEIDMFVQVIQGQVSDAAQVRAHLDTWVSEVAPGAIGWLGSTGGVTDDGNLIALVRFEDEEKAQQNSDRPEQGAWWEKMASLFDGEPTFHNSTRVEVDTPGDPASGRLRAGDAGPHQ